MTEEQIKEMLNGIINNGEKWEYRPTIPCCNYNCGSCNDDGNRCAFFNDLSKMPTCASYSTGNTRKESEWQPYKLGDKIHDDYEYRKVEEYAVAKFTNVYSVGLKSDLSKNATIYFESKSKEECEKWIEEHTKQTWLEECLNDDDIDNMEHNLGFKNGATEVCKKVLEEVYKKVVFKDFENYESGSALCITLDNLEQIIKDLGVEL